MADAPVPHPGFPALAERGGTPLRTPRATVLVDTGEQNPFDLSRFGGWFARVEKKALTVGYYSIAGLEDVCVVERKSFGPSALGDDRTRNLCEPAQEDERLSPINCW